MRDKVEQWVLEALKLAAFSAAGGLFLARLCWQENLFSTREHFFMEWIIWGVIVLVVLIRFKLPAGL